MPTLSQPPFQLGLVKRIIPEAEKNLYYGDGFISKIICDVYRYLFQLHSSNVLGLADLEGNQHPCSD